MKRIVVGSLMLLLPLAACGNQRTGDGKDPVFSPEREIEGAVQKVTSEQISQNWVGVELAAALTGSEQILATASDDLVRIKRIAEGEALSSGPTTGARIHSFLPTFGDTSGVTLRITVEARAVSGDSAILNVAYSTNIKGNSGWQVCEFSVEFDECAFEYTLGDGPDNNGDYVGFSVEGLDQVEIKSVSIL